MKSFPQSLDAIGLLQDFLEICYWISCWFYPYVLFLATAAVLFAW